MDGAKIGITGHMTMTSPSITPQFLDQLRNRLTLSDVIGSRIKVIRTGREFKACCPFHKEKTPSFTINDDKQFFHCFGCGEHGDAVGFVMKHDNLSFPEAVELLAAKAGMQVPKASPAQAKKAREEKSLYDLVDLAANWYHDQLNHPKYAMIKSYMIERGISEHSQNIFRIGYAPAQDDHLYKMLKDKGFTDNQMVDSGLFRRSKKQYSGRPPLYPFLRERVIFPVGDRRGRQVAFGGRILPDAILKKLAALEPPSQHSSGSSDYTPPKYLNLSETPIFSKGRMLYSESRARIAAGDGQPIIVVEGYMDVIACYQAGFHGAVAPLGTALTEDQIASCWAMLRDKPKLPILCFDGDAAGMKAAERACERILPLIKSDQSVRIAFLPEGEDPDSIIKAKGPQAFQDHLDQALYLIDFIWNRARASRHLETPEDRAGFESDLDAQTAKITDRQLQHHYRQIIKDKLFQEFRRRPQNGHHHNKGGFKKGFKGGYNGGNGPSLATPRKGLNQMAQQILREKIMLACLINHPDIFSHVEEKFAMLILSNPRLDLLRQYLVDFMTNHTHNDPSAPPLVQELRQSIITNLTENGFDGELAVILNEGLYTHAGFARPERDQMESLEGWRDLWSVMAGQNAASEIKKFGKELAQGLSTNPQDIDNTQNRFFEMIREQEYLNNDKE